MGRHRRRRWHGPCIVGEASRSCGWTHESTRARPCGAWIFGYEVTTVATATMTSPMTTPARLGNSGDFVQDIMEAASRIDERLRLSLTPREYAMVQDLVLATRITTIALDAAEDHAEPTAA